VESFLNETVVNLHGRGPGVDPAELYRDECLEGYRRILDLDVPPEVGPLSVRCRPDVAIPGVPKPGAVLGSGLQLDHLHLAGAALRRPPAQRHFAETPLDQAEVTNGLVRLRTTNAGGAAQLLLTSDSQELATSGTRRRATQAERSSPRSPHLEPGRASLLCPSEDTTVDRVDDRRSPSTARPRCRTWAAKR